MWIRSQYFCCFLQFVLFGAAHFTIKPCRLVGFYWQEQYLNKIPGYFVILFNFTSFYFVIENFFLQTCKFFIGNRKFAKIEGKVSRNLLIFSFCFFFSLFTILHCLLKILLVAMEIFHFIQQNFPKIRVKFVCVDRKYFLVSKDRKKHVREKKRNFENIS